MMQNVGNQGFKVTDMPTMSQAMHHYVAAKLTSAAELLNEAQRSIPTPPDYGNFERALAVIEEGRSALAAEFEVDAVARILRATASELGNFCGGPAEASVNAALGLIDQAIGGETMRGAGRDRRAVRCRRRFLHSHTCFGDGFETCRLR